MQIFTDDKTGEQYAEIPTRAPVKMQVYAKTLAFAKGVTLKTMYAEAAERFLREAPWEGGLTWRPTKGLTTTLKDGVGQTDATGWMQVNMRLPVEIGNALERKAAEQNVSLSSASYTMMYWLTWWVYPPATERQRRDKASADNGAANMNHHRSADILRLVISNQRSAPKAADVDPADQGQDMTLDNAAAEEENFSMPYQQEDKAETGSQFHSEDLE